MKYNYNNSIKRLVRELIFDNLPKANIVSLVGPELESVLKDIYRYTYNESPVYLYENNPEVMVQTLLSLHDMYKNKDKSLFPEKFLNNINIVFDDVKNAEPRNIMDLDFCATFDYVKDTVSLLLDKQETYKPRGVDVKKSFIITCSERTTSETTSIDCFINWYSKKYGKVKAKYLAKRLTGKGIKLGGKIESTSMQSNIYATLYDCTNNKSTNVLNEFIIKYNAGGGPMFVWFITYK